MVQETYPLIIYREETTLKDCITWKRQNMSRKFNLQIFPLEDGRSVIPPEQLQKEIAKGTIVMPDPNRPKELDGDMDEYVDKVVLDIWRHYDPKGTGMMPKKVIQKFFKVNIEFGDLLMDQDSLDLYVLRKGLKKSEVVAPGVKMGQAMTECVAKVLLK